MINEPIWIEGTCKLINASGTALEGLWFDGASRLYGEYKVSGIKSYMGVDKVNIKAINGVLMGSIKMVDGICT